MQANTNLQIKIRENRKRANLFHTPKSTFQMPGNFTANDICLLFQTGALQYNMARSRSIQHSLMLCGMGNTACPLKKSRDSDYADRFDADTQPIQTLGAVNQFCLWIDDRYRYLKPNSKRSAMIE